MAKPQEVEQVQDHEVDQKLKDRGYDVDWNQRLGGNDKRPGILTTVYKIKEPVNSSRETLAIKEIILEKASEFYERLYEQSKRELEIMKKLKSRNNKNIIEFIDYIEFEVEKTRVVSTGIIKSEVRTDKYRYIYFIMEYCDMSLQKYLEKYGGRLNPEEMKVFFRQIRNGLEALHQDEKMKILHRDLKPDNILLKMDDVGIKEGDDETEKRKKCLKATLKIADFGLSKICNETDTCLIGTPMYMAPEVLFNRDDCYNSNADMWCVGIMLYRCLTGRLPYPTQTSKEKLKDYFVSIEDEESLVDNDLRPIRPTNGDENEVFRLNNEPEWRDKTQELSEWKSLIKDLLKIQILDRMNFETFKKHPFVYNLIEGEIEFRSNIFSFNNIKKSAIQENSHIDEDDPNFFRHCMVEKFSLQINIGIDENLIEINEALQLIKQKFDGKLLVQHLRITNYVTRKENRENREPVFSWAEKLSEVFEFAEYSTLSLSVDEKSINYIVNNPSSIRFELIKSINVEWIGTPVNFVETLFDEDIVLHDKLLNFVINQENGKNRDCLKYYKNFIYNPLKEFMRKFCQLFETNSEPECIFKEVRLKVIDYGKNPLMNENYKSRYGCYVESLDNWPKFLEDLGFIYVGHEDVYGYNTKPIKVHEKSRADGWKLRILWSEDNPYNGFYGNESSNRIKLRLKISKEFLRPIKKGYFVLYTDGNVYMGDGGDEKLKKDILEHQFHARGDEFMIMPLRNCKRYRFEHVALGHRVEEEKLREWVKQRGGVIPVVNLYLQILHNTGFISVHSLRKFEFSMLKLTLLHHSDFDELATNPSVIYFPSAKSININVEVEIEPIREYDKLLDFIFNNKCINLDKIHFFTNIIDFTEEFVKEFIERFKSTTYLEYAWKNVLIDSGTYVFWGDLDNKDKEEAALQSLKRREYFDKMINEWDNTLNKLGFRPSVGEISEKFFDRSTERLVWKSHVLEKENGWKLKILSSQELFLGEKNYFWKFQIYK